MCTKLETDATAIHVCEALPLCRDVIGCSWEGGNCSGGMAEVRPGAGQVSAW